MRTPSQNQRMEVTLVACRLGRVPPRVEPRLHRRSCVPGSGLRGLGVAGELADGEGQFGGQLERTLVVRVASHPQAHALDDGTGPGGVATQRETHGHRPRRERVDVVPLALGEREQRVAVGVVVDHFVLATTEQTVVPGPVAGGLTHRHGGRSSGPSCERAVGGRCWGGPWTVRRGLLGQYRAHDSEAARHLLLTLPANAVLGLPQRPPRCLRPYGQSGHLSVVQEVGTTVRHGQQGVKYRGAKGLRACPRAVGADSTTLWTNVQDGRTRLIIQLTNEITRPPSRAAQKPSTWNGTFSRSAIHEVRSSMSALTTNVNRPSVMT